jgi:hypothetical protein
MADETNASIQSASPQGQQDGGFRGGRGGREGGGREGSGREGAREGGGRDGGNREPGGFRIRLSENEMRAARAIQAGRVWVNAYHLYPTHAAFGGYKQSGIGRENHQMMLSHFRQTKNMLVSYGTRALGFF